MFDATKGYDPANPLSIEGYALQLKDKTFMEIAEAKGFASTDSRIASYADSSRKGGLGNLLEELYFGYKANSNQDADFPEAGVELKATPCELSKKGEISAGERLVLTMISYKEPVEIEFYESHAWKKMRLILLIYYLRNKEIKNRLLYPIKYVKLFTPPEKDLAIIKKDYDYIVEKIRNGLAHELSESDTMYLGACTKGRKSESSIVPQYYGDKIPARKRAFCLKMSYMTYALRSYISNPSPDNSIIKNVGLLEKKSFEDILNDIVYEFIGLSDRELCERYGREYNNNKAQWNDLAYKILGVRGEQADEFIKANIRVKSIRVEMDDSITESMSFPPINFKEFSAEEYDDSVFHEYFEETKFFFFIWKRDGDVYRVKGCKLWSMPYGDLEGVARYEWEKCQNIIKQGVEFTKKIDSRGKTIIYNNLPKKSETKILHLRPHTKLAAYRFSDGETIGNVERDADELPNGEYMTIQSFWINNTYILNQIKDYL